MRYIQADDFSLRDTVESGQTFNWIEKEAGYISTDLGQVVYVEQRKNRLYYETSHHGPDLRGLFRLDDPLTEIQKEIVRDDTMRASVDFAPGLRIVSNPFYPCLISFICSIRKNIPTIKSIMQSFRDRFGPTYQFRGEQLKGFPSPEQVAEASPKDLRGLGLGWRADFVYKTTQAILQDDVSEAMLREMEYEAAHKKLKTLHGVGDKVADCVCLFSLGFLEAFPIDVWIERVIQDKYGILSSAGKSYAKKSRAAREYFGKYAGYAQEYLFHYTRMGNQYRSI